MRSVSTLAVTTTVSLILAACGAGDGDKAAQKAEIGSGTGAPVAPGGGPSTAGAGLWNNGQTQPLSLQFAHPNGTVVQLTSIQARDTETAIGIRVINGHSSEVKLNLSPNNRNGYIVTTSGERLYLSPPANNRDLAIVEGQTLEGELIFLGRLSPGADATLVLNEGRGDSEYTNSPAFRFQLPAPTAAAAS